MDTESCFFRDDEVPLPVCMGLGLVPTPGCINPAHRKIVTYVRSLAPPWPRPPPPTGSRTATSAFSRPCVKRMPPVLACENRSLARSRQDLCKPV